MAIALIDHQQAGGSGSGAALSGVATLNTTGATLMTVALTYYSGSGAPVFSSSPAPASGSWVTAASQVGAQSLVSELYYIYGSQIGANSYTFSNSTADYSVVFVSSWSGTLTSGDPLDGTPVTARDDGATQVSSLAVGPITPNQANSLVFSSIGLRGFTAKNKPGGVSGGSLALLDQTDASATGLEGGGAGYEIQTTATARTATWATFTAVDFCAAMIAVFKPSGGAAAFYPRPGLTVRQAVNRAGTY